MCHVEQNFRDREMKEILANALISYVSFREKDISFCSFSRDVYRFFFSSGVDSIFLGGI
jgi:hypothetical protein